jgi:hypothetical protein
MKILAITLALLALISCNKKDDDDDDDDNGGVTLPDYKATLSSWKVEGGGAWNVRLDINANLSGTPFMMVVKFSDSSEVHCTTATLAGSEANGSWTASGCASTGGTMADSVGGVPFTTTGGGGTYENLGNVLKLCRNGTNGCLNYYP